MTHTAQLTEINTPLNTVILQQRCLHTLTGRAPEHKMCAHGYVCGSCPFDQMIDEIDEPARRNPSERRTAAA
jgi:hypothetical protein